MSSIFGISLFCSFIFIARAVMIAVHRYKITIWALTFIGLLSLYMFIGRVLYNGFSVYSYTNLLTVCTIPVLLITGMKLIDKYGEV